MNYIISPAQINFLNFIPIETCIACHITETLFLKCKIKITNFVSDYPLLYQVIRDSTASIDHMIAF